MILIDTSIWIDHLRSTNQLVIDLTRRENALGHPLVLGELAMGSLEDRSGFIFRLQNIPQARMFDNDDVMRFVDRRRLHGRGIGYIDAHLLLSVASTPGASLWTRDKRLQTVAEELKLTPGLPGTRLQ